MKRLRQLAALVLSCDLAGCGASGGTSSSVPLPQANSQVRAMSVVMNAVTTTLTQETPTWSDTFVDSIGVNTHLDYTDTSYFTNYQGFRNAFLATGIRHIRDSLVTTGDQFYYNELMDLASNGVHADLVTGISAPAQLISQYPTYVPGVIESFEGPNEWDASGDPNWIADLTNEQTLLYQTVKGNVTTANIPVLGPAMAQAWSYTKLGSLASVMDEGNVHDYMAGHRPGSPGWGTGGFGSAYGAISYWIGAAEQTSGSHPMIASETGYCTAPGYSAAGAIDVTTQDRYFPRLYLLQWMKGIKRTYAYEFLDNGTGCNGSYGLLTSSMTPRPVYGAISSMVATLSDPGGSLSPQPLSYTISTAITTLDHTLFQKKDGTYILALWNEIPSNTSAGVAITQTPVPVTLTMPSAPVTASAQSITDLGGLQSSPITQTANQITLNVTDSVTFVRFHF